MFRLSIFIILLLVMVSGIFFFWASSPTLEESAYAKVFRNTSPATTDNDSMYYSIVTYNIGYLSGIINNLPVERSKELFDENLKKVMTEIEAVNSDIIAFQEIDYDATRSYEVNQQNEIAKLGYNYIAQAINWDKTYIPFPYWPPSTHFGKVVSGQSIISKYPIKNQDRIVLERVASHPFYKNAFYLDRLAQVITVVLEKKEVMVINVHLEAFDKVTRAKQLDAVLELFHTYVATHPTILLGDFNSDPRYESPAIQKVLNLPNVGSAAFSEGHYEFTFDTKNPFERLDYIFYTKNTIEYIDGKVLKQFGQASDHLPVEMRFRLK